MLGFQGKAQLEVIYGHLAEVMLSQPATKIFMKTAEPKAAEWISEAIGKVEIERLKETKFDGSRSGKNFTVDRQIEPLVMGSEISGLDDRHAYLKLGNNVARFAFDYLDLPTPTPGFLPRKSPDGEMSFDPDTLEPRFLRTPAPDDEHGARSERHQCLEPRVTARTIRNRSDCVAYASRPCSKQKSRKPTLSRAAR